MQRIATVDNQFHNKDAVAGVAGTTVTAAWLNAIQEELALALEAFGVVLNPADNTQLKTLLQLIGDAERATFGTVPTGFNPALPSTPVEFYRNRGMVSITFPVIAGTSNAQGFTLPGMPSTIRPQGTRVCYVRITDNATAGAISEGIASISAAGVISFYRGTDSGPFSTIGNKSVQICTITYYI